MTEGSKKKVSEAELIAAADECGCLCCKLRATLYRYRLEKQPDANYELIELDRFIGTVIGEGTAGLPVSQTVSLMAAHNAGAVMWALDARHEPGAYDPEEMLQPMELPEGVSEATDEEIEAILKQERKSRGRLN